MSPDVEPQKCSKTDQNCSESVLRNALLMTEVGIDLKDRFIAGEKYIYYLKNVLSGAEKSITALHLISKSTLEQAQAMLRSINDGRKELSPPSIRQESEKLLSLLDKQLTDLEVTTMEASMENLNISQIVEKIKQLEMKQRNSDNNISPPTSSSNKSIKADIDEKYPENLSRESLIDLNAVINLPPVPEDIFTSFSNKPTRSSSLSSLKSIRKIKLFLQKAESSDDEDSSDNDDYAKLVYGDIDDNKGSGPHSPVAKKQLGNITEEGQD